MTTKLLALTLFATLAFNLAACGGSSESPKDQVKTAANNFVQAAQDKNAAALCDNLAPASQKRLAALANGNCETAAKKIIATSTSSELAKAKAKIKTGNVTIQGNTATVDIGEASGGKVNLQKIGDKWLVSLSDVMDQTKAAQDASAKTAIVNVYKALKAEYVAHEMYNADSVVAAMSAEAGLNVVPVPEGTPPVQGKTYVSLSSNNQKVTVSRQSESGTDYSLTAIESGPGAGLTKNW